MQRVIPALALAICLAAPASGRDDLRPSFLADVAPILRDHCFTCHDTKKKSGKLVMTSFAALRRGGVHGDPVVPGKPEESELLAVLTAGDERMMPPAGKGGPLAADKIAVIERWVRDGARLDDGLDAAADLSRELRKRWTPPTPPEAYPAPVTVNALAFTPNGERLVAGGYHELTVWDVPSGRLAARVRTRAERTYGVTFLADGLLAVAGGRPGQEGDVCVYDIHADAAGELRRLDGVGDPRVRVARLLTADDSVLSVATTPDGRWLAAGGCDRTARVWELSSEVRNSKLSATVETHADWVTGVTLSADGSRLLTASRDKAAKVFDLRANAPELTFGDHQAPVHDVAGSSDAHVAFSVGADKMLRLWKPESGGKQIKAVGGHGDEVLRVVAHPAEPWVLTASADKTVRVWRTDGAAVRTLSGLRDTPFALAVSPDGRLAAAGGAGGIVRVWTIADGKPVADFQASPGLTARQAR